MVRWLPIFILSVATGRGDVVHLGDGTKFEGQMRLVEGRLEVISATGAIQRMEWSRVQRIVRTVNAEPPKPQPPVLPEGALPIGWRALDIGQLLQPGKSVFDDGRFTLITSGRDIEALQAARVQDAFRFVFRPLHGNGEVVARVAMLTHDGKWKTKKNRAGVILRSGLGAGGINYILTLDARGHVNLRNYTNRGGGGRSFPGLHHRTPIWLKLRRQDAVVTGYASKDGKLWREVAAVRPNKNLPEVLYAGIMGTGFKEPETQAVLDQVRVTAVQDEDHWQPRVILTGGAELTWPVTGLDEARVTFEVDQPIPRLPRTALARLQFVPSESLPGNLRGSGVSLRNGDYVKGEIRMIREGRVTVSSILFGIQHFDLAGEVAAVQFVEPHFKQTRWEVKLADGSRLWVDEVKLAGDRLQVQHRQLPRWSFSMEQLKGIRRIVEQD